MILADLFQQKEYRNMPVQVTDFMLDDRNMTAHGYVMWVKLHREAFFTDDWSICQSKKDLAQIFNGDITTLAQAKNNNFQITRGVSDDSL